MKRFIAVILCAVLTASVLCSCCFHKSSGKATCTKDEVCVKCGKVLEKKLGHDPNIEAPTCTKAQKCKRCDEVLQKALGHTPDGTDVCTKDIKCTVCGKVIQKKQGHKKSIKKATCFDDVVCTVCGKVLEKSQGHIPSGDVSETQAQYCKECGLIISPALNSPLGTPIYNKNEVTDQGAPAGSYTPEHETGHYVKGAVSHSLSGGIASCGNYMMETFSVNKNGSDDYAATVTAFAKKFPKVNVSCMIVPKCSTFHTDGIDGIDDLYENHKSFISSTYKKMKGVTTPDAFGELEKHRDEYLFYRTDHHWTSLGAYYASVAFCKANGIKPKKLDTYKTVVNTDFSGTLYSTFWSGPLPNGILTDYTVAHIPQTAYTLTYSTDENTYAGTAFGSAIKQNAKNYAAAFLGGDRAFTHIMTAGKSNRRLMIFKESYGNSFAPYMIDYYKEIIVIDIRYSNASVKKLIKDYKITDVLVINNIQAVTGLHKYVKERLES